MYRRDPTGKVRAIRDESAAAVCYTQRVRVWRPILLALLVAAASCSDVASDETPIGAVRLFLDAMQRAQLDPAAVREAYALLASPTRRALMERAHLAGSLGGREFQPWEMLVRGRYRQTYPVRDGSGMRESIQGSNATVTVREENGSRSSTIALRLEDGHWRLVIDVPPPR